MKSDLSPVPFPNGKGCLLDEQLCIVAYLDSIQARLASLRELQSDTGEELDALSSSPSVASGIPSVLRPQGGRFEEKKEVMIKGDVKFITNT